MAAGIDHGGIPVDGPFRDAGVIILVDMPVDEVFRAVLVQQGHKALKTPVGPGVKVVDVPRRRVGEQDVEAPHFQSWNCSRATRRAICPSVYMWAPFR